MKNRNLFISHSWTYGDAYEKLVGLLDAAPRFEYSNYSVPKDDPIHNAPNTTALTAAIKSKMSFCHVVIIVAGVYATYSDWIDREIQLANSGFSTPKKILGINPFGSERTSTVVRTSADLMANWNTNSIVSAIRELSP